MSNRCRVIKSCVSDRWRVTKSGMVNNASVMLTIKDPCSLKCLIGYQPVIVLCTFPYIISYFKLCTLYIVDCTNIMFCRSNSGTFKFYILLYFLVPIFSDIDLFNSGPFSMKIIKCVLNYYYSSTVLLYYCIACTSKYCSTT